MSIGKNIKEFRKQNKLTQVELAKKANMSRSYLADIEGDRYNPSLETLRTVADALGVSTSNILDGKESLGHFIKSNREALGLSASNVAERVGINETQLLRIENEERDYFLNSQIIRRLAGVLDISYTQLFEISGFLSDFSEQEKNEFLSGLYKQDYLNEQLRSTFELFDFSGGETEELMQEFIDELSKIITSSKKKITFSFHLTEQKNYQELINKISDIDDIPFKSNIIELLSSLASKYHIAYSANPLPFKSEREFVGNIDLSDKQLTEKYTIVVDGRELTEKEMRKVIGLVRMEREFEEE
ncbi:helix-turn-helix domain-containing protein [Paenibacillus crassostreae]|uniref:helix-turn-helix domain-containing protein n=1 Tax=Paenibacillus crassostreae TaxID=1763538 RepID=UPI0009ED76D9|nr:helix-turn-helix transcriptional regulator [Paenibacillus crassostreae]